MEWLNALTRGKETKSKPEVDYDPAYPVPSGDDLVTPSTSDGQSDLHTSQTPDGVGSHSDPDPVRAAELRELEVMRKRLSDKDRHIEDLRREKSAAIQLMDQHPGLAGTPPAPNAESDPALLDEDTLALFDTQYQSDPGGAVAGLIDYSQKSIMSKVDEKLAERDQASAMQTRATQVEGHVESQLLRAEKEFGPQASQIADEFRVKKENSWLGETLLADPNIVLGPEGVFRLIHYHLLTVPQEPTTEGDYHMPDDVVNQGAPSTVSRPSAPVREGPMPTNVKTAEDQISDSIVGATNKGASAARGIFLGQS